MLFDADCRVADDPAAAIQALIEPWPKFQAGMIMKGVKRAV
jgi:hypothetical protein